MVRLETLALEVARHLRHLPEPELREIALAACDFALARTNFKAPIVTEARDRLARGESLSPESLAALERLATELDERYLELQDATDPAAPQSAVLRAFADARAAAALLHAFDPDALTAATEAVYEAAMTAENPSDLFAEIDPSLTR
ncbi:MAG: hypothetical protein KY476_17235 [Planctomycetes bacterium]|nr:hypothetical protein [Planctomycetota bacterium]